MLQNRIGLPDHHPGPSSTAGRSVRPRREGWRMSQTVTGVAGSPQRMQPASSVRSWPRCAVRDRQSSLAPSLRWGSAFAERCGALACNARLPGHRDLRVLARAAVSWTYRPAGVWRCRWSLDGQRRDPRPRLVSCQPRNMAASEHLSMRPGYSRCRGGRASERRVVPPSMKHWLRVESGPGRRRAPDFSSSDPTRDAGSSGMCDHGYRAAAHTQYRAH